MDNEFFRVFGSIFMSCLAMAVLGGFFYMLYSLRR